MTRLQNHEEFLKLLERNENEPLSVVKYGASWCNPCKRIDKSTLLGLSDKIKWYEVDIDENEETSTYVGVKTIPCFLGIRLGVPQPLFQSSDTAKVAEWVKNGFKAF